MLRKSRDAKQGQTPRPIYLGQVEDRVLSPPTSVLYAKLETRSTFKLQITMVSLFSLLFSSCNIQAHAFFALFLLQKSGKGAGKTGGKGKGGKASLGGSGGAEKGASRSSRAGLQVS
jgi:hypothetical protein